MAKFFAGIFESRRTIDLLELPLDGNDLILLEDVMRKLQISNADFNYILSHFALRRSDFGTALNRLTSTGGNVRIKKKFFS